MGTGVKAGSHKDNGDQPMGAQCYNQYSEELFFAYFLPVLFANSITPQ